MAATDFELHQGIFNKGHLKLPYHAGPGFYDSYLTIDLPFAPIASLRKQIENRLQFSLKHRGEAHITVITPVEYSRFIKPYALIDEIYSLAQQADLQKANFKILCLGEGAKLSQNKTFKNYFIVITSPELIAFRKQVHDLIKKKNRGASSFDPNAYYPHITVGFTDRDLHLSDGVIKNEQSCSHKISLKTYSSE